MEVGGDAGAGGGVVVAPGPVAAVVEQVFVEACGGWPVVALGLVAGSGCCPSSRRWFVLAGVLSHQASQSRQASRWKATVMVLVSPRIRRLLASGATSRASRDPGGVVAHRDERAHPPRGAVGVHVARPGTDPHGGRSWAGCVELAGHDCLPVHPVRISVPTQASGERIGPGRLPVRSAAPAGCRTAGRCRPRGRCCRAGLGWPGGAVPGPGPVSRGRSARRLP